MSKTDKTKRKVINHKYYEKNKEYYVEHKRKQRAQARLKKQEIKIISADEPTSKITYVQKTKVNVRSKCESNHGSEEVSS